MPICSLQFWKGGLGKGIMRFLILFTTELDFFQNDTTAKMQVFSDIIVCLE